MFRQALLVAAFVGLAITSPVHAQSSGAAPEVKLGFAKCAQCLSMALVPQFTKAVKIDAINFTSGNDVLTALVSRSVDIAQVTYLHFVTALDRGLDVVAVSGQVNGGSAIVMRNGLNLKQDDWAGLKKLVDDAKAKGSPLKIAASRGNAQDLHMRGELQMHGIDPNKDVQFINIPNPADHVGALQRGEIDLVCSVEPFASQIRLSGAGKLFNFPYEQAAGKLSNLIVTRSDMIKDHPEEVRATVAAVVKMVDSLKTDKTAWLDSIKKYTALDKTVAIESLKNAYPDYHMYRTQTVAIAKMMKDLRYVSTDVTGGIEKNMNYTFLSEATGQPKTALGY
ncbi:ABC transporter substrate-binding component [Pandoraea communis]|uniref:ABC transporter substrate-binding component n=1 Tax=Pandoraea communis TaxID=2508297 RepID=A0A5E4SYT2_9BURK|nr:ABC transporter substrate-binding protein [Pandoraea communis]VVD78949.1 ABC transporter substrate-binding component [Pandoraea communis]